jgi:hypothetical protein
MQDGAVLSTAVAMAESAHQREVVREIRSWYHADVPQHTVERLLQIVVKAVEAVSVQLYSDEVCSLNCLNCSVM